MHTGRVAHTLNLPVNTKVLAPSAEQLKGETWTDQMQLQPYPVPHAMSIDDINNTIDEYTNSAKLAIEAGFDGVELHGANGYLIQQFINPAVNKRLDQYGGSIKNRIRFVLEIARKTADIIGGNKLGIRISPYGVSNGMTIYDEIDETYSLLTEKLSELGLVYMHIVDHSALGAPPVKPSIKAEIRNKFKGTIILSGGYDVERAEKDLFESKGDLVAFGRYFIANPDLVKKFKDGGELLEADRNTFYSPGPKGYIDYPVN